MNSSFSFRSFNSVKTVLFASVLFLILLRSRIINETKQIRTNKPIEPKYVETEKLSSGDEVIELV